MNEGKELLREIRDAQENSKETDRFIDKYAPFVRSEALRFSSATDHALSEDLYSIALFAFYEALMNYDKEKGAFFPMARVYIKNRLIDFTRKERNGEGSLSLDEPLADESSTTLLDTLSSERDTIEWQEERECTKEEIEDFTKTLSLYGLTLTEIADNAPRQERTMALCLDALDYAKAHPDILDSLVETKKLPMSRLVREGGFERKSLERHRKYLVGIFLAFTNGFVIIRGHLKAMKGARHD